MRIVPVCELDHANWTNNTAERGLRSYVIWRKLSFMVQSWRGEQYLPMALSVVGTAQRLGLSTYALLRQMSTEHVATGQVTTRLPLDAPQLTAP